ncbi:alpha/beta hydrolase [Acinetobacter sp. 194]|uniref:alpha/beta fold hydrolase n=1 Tax=Acinetobacter shaoyimingii TaxID=2715164 RepID=UPI00140C164F|nr:alpha/beta hydrolase [Acinetobacter shaoyimingii]NHB56502.1 alpha/beta hydrolase [Acinetobacter shaoyimingii]
MNSQIQIDSEAYPEKMPTSFFDLYDKNSFKQPARVTWIRGWKIEYMAIADPKTLNKTPIVIVGGAFQNFNSYKYCVEQLFESGPVILIDLPSLGANQQIRNRDTGESAAILELPELSKMLGEWLDLVEIRKVSVMGMSLGSVVASCFAHERPDLIERMILMGVMQKTRKSWRMLLEESLMLMKEQRMDEFGQAVILYLVNHAKLNKTKMSPTAKRLFFKQMAEFSDTEKERYEINCNRLLSLEYVPVPSCKTLVACGQYDSFTLPHENANFALQCPDVQFALIANADHVPQLQRRKETLNLFSHFLQAKPLNQVEGIIELNREQMSQLQQRGEDRIEIEHSHSFLTHREQQLQIDVDIININYFGVLMEMGDMQSLKRVTEYPRDLALHLQDEEGDFKVECLIFETQGTQVRALFKHGSFDVAERLFNFLEANRTQQAQPISSLSLC